MTLIEILVVLAIIGLIMGGVAVVAFRALARAKVKVATTDIKKLDTAVGIYRIDPIDKRMDKYEVNTLTGREDLGRSRALASVARS